MRALSLSKTYAEAEQEFETAMRLDPKLYEAPYIRDRLSDLFSTE